MMFPDTFRDNEYVRLIALRRDFHGNVIASKVEYVNTFQDYAAFVQKYRYTHDVYNQIATNRGKEKGTKNTQRQRKVLFLDFDKKDYPELQDASDFTKWIHNKLSKCFRWKDIPEQKYILFVRSITASADHQSKRR